MHPTIVLETAKSLRFNTCSEITPDSPQSFLYTNANSTSFLFVLPGSVHFCEKLIGHFLALGKAFKS